MQYNVVCKLFPVSVAVLFAMATGEQNIENYLGFRLRGGSRERHGHIEWPLEYFQFSEREWRERGGEGRGGRGGGEGGREGGGGRN